MPTFPETLQGWLEHCERLHPKNIDLGLERVREVAQRLELRFACPVITVAGTNGKGSTCAMLEAIAQQAGYRTGVYGSPHLVHFEERCRLQGTMVAAADLLEHFAAVERARTTGGAEVSLTYFEFTTLAIMRLMSHAHLDLAILEVGLGGRLDATNVIDPDCAVITSVDIDHVELLGPDRESIGREKAGIMRAGRPVVVSDPMPPQSVLEHARAIGADLWIFGHDFNYSGDPQQWAWAGRGRRYAGLAYPALRGANQLVNAAGALAALEALRGRLPITAQAVRVGLSRVELPGRFQIIPGQPTLVLDVAHNPHSAAALAANLDAMGHFPVTHAVFGAMADKDLAPMLNKLGPLVDYWYFTDLPTPRAQTAAGLQQQWQTLVDAAAEPGASEPPPYKLVRTSITRDGKSSAWMQVSRSKTQAQQSSDAQPQGNGHMPITSVHASPQDALQAALDVAGAADRIVVFGSFYTVGGILQNGVPRLQAKHLGA